MVRLLRAQFGEFGSRIEQGDFTLNLPFESGFDLIVDRASVTHNSTPAIEATLELVWQALKPAAYFIGVDWFSTACSEFARGQGTADPHTRAGYTQGPLAGTGRVHFSDEGHLHALFGRFELMFLEEKVTRQVLPAGDRFTTWNLVARRPLG
jgi:SAM-dependent methyltransferase